MITRVPDITRLVDRLEKMGMVGRERAPKGDRRQVLVQITAKGLECLAPLDAVLEAHMTRMFAGLSAGERRSLVEILGRVGVTV